MLIFQILASIFILFVLSRVFARYRDKQVPKSEVIVWIVFWLVIALAVWWPSGTDVLAKAVGVSRGVDLILAASVAVIFYSLFKLFSQVHSQQREITELVRKLGLEEHKDESKSNEQYEND